MSATARSRPCCSWRCGWAGRCSSKARPASARPRSPRCWRRRSGRRLIRLQCYEGLDVAAAVYEWNYAAQMIAIRARRSRGRARPRAARARRVLRALPDQAAAAAGAGARPGRRAGAADRRTRPHRRGVRGVPARSAGRLPGDDPRTRHGQGRRSRRSSIITSNRTREIHDALKRRCLYHWVGYPNADARTGDRARQGAGHRARSCRADRRISCRRCASRTCSSRPASPRRSTGRRRLSELDVVALDPATVSDTLGVLLKYQDDIARLDGTKVEGIARRGAGGAAGGGVTSMSEHRTTEGRLAENIVYFARALRAAGIPVGPGSVLDALAGGAGRRRRHARGFLLDAACGVREAARAFGAVRSGVPDLLPQARLSRTS